jgi:hypothetical protein
VISREEARLVLQKWRDEHTPVRVSAHVASGIFNFDCRRSPTRSRSERAVTHDLPLCQKPLRNRNRKSFVLRLCDLAF